MGRHTLFSLYHRKRKNSKPVWYVMFKQPNGHFGSGKNSGCLSRSEAEAWAVAYLHENGIVDNTGIFIHKENKVNFEDFTKNFFSWDSEWATNKRVTGKRITLRQCKEKTAILTKRLIPAFQGVPLSKIDTTTVKAFRNNLYQAGYTGSTINKALSCLKVILESAEEKSIIRYMPKIERASTKTKQRGILTVKEVKRLFSIDWSDFRCYVMTLMAACTGLRRGELMALQLNQIRGDYIEVLRSWDEVTKTMNETTKTGRSRTVIIPSNLKAQIELLIKDNPWSKPDSFLFYSTLERKPIEGSIINREFYKALEKINIDNDERRRRNITFHSWRHWFNSLLINARIPLQKIQSMTGHLTAEMTQHYYHIDDMTDIQQIQDKIIS